MKSSTLIVLVLLLAALSTSGASRPNFFKALFAMGSREKTTGAATDMGPDSIENTLAFVFNFEIAWDSLHWKKLRKLVVYTCNKIIKEPRGSNFKLKLFLLNRAPGCWRAGEVPGSQLPHRLVLPAARLDLLRRARRILRFFERLLSLMPSIKTWILLNFDSLICKARLWKDIIILLGGISRKLSLFDLRWICAEHRNSFHLLILTDRSLMRLLSFCLVRLLL